jgi:hypothetical protein
MIPQSLPDATYSAGSRHGPGASAPAARSGGTKNKLLHTVLDRGIEQIHTIRHIVAKILRRILHRLADEGVGCKMHDGVGFHFANRMVDDGPVGQITLEKFGARLDRLAMTFGQIVEDCDFITFIEQLLDANAPNVTCSARDKNGFHGSANAIFETRGNQ